MSFRCHNLFVSFKIFDEQKCCWRNSTCPTEAGACSSSAITVFHRVRRCLWDLIITLSLNCFDLESLVSLPQVQPAQLGVCRSRSKVQSLSPFSSRLRRSLVGYAANTLLRVRLQQRQLRRPPQVFFGCPLRKIAGDKLINERFEARINNLIFNQFDDNCQPLGLAEFRKKTTILYSSVGRHDSIRRQTTEFLTEDVFSFV